MTLEESKIYYDTAAYVPGTIHDFRGREKLYLFLPEAKQKEPIYPRPKGNPDYAFAFKMIISDQVAEAKVLDVIWTPSKDGYLKPRVQIEPVTLGGVKIEYATGFNAKIGRAHV